MIVSNTNRCSILLIIIALSFFSCKKDDNTIDSTDSPPNTSPTLPETLFNYESSNNFPEHFTNDPLLSLFTNNFDSTINPITNEGATLGRVLFYDKKLSINNEIACASCHHQENAFTDPLTKSIGIFGQEGSRNSMGFQNLRLNSRMFWDHRVNGLQNQIPFPIQDPTEMGMNMDSLIVKLSDVNYYDQLFIDAYGDNEITSARIANNVTQFIHSITTFQSKYDDGVENDFMDFTALENEGMNLFFGGVKRCNHCHSTQNFYSREAMNNGLDEEYADQGQFLATGNETDKGEFRVPSLRNVAVTGPYMHDGRFISLEEVLDHYSTGVQSHPNLNDRITEELTTGGTPFLLNLTDQEKLALIAFLNTLTDPVMLTDVRFSDPF